MTLLSLRGLRAGYVQQGSIFQVLDGIDLEVARGSTLGIVGESGSGKSTLAKAIVGLVPCTADRFEFDSQDVNVTKARNTTGYRRRVQMIFQDAAASLNPRMQVAGLLKEAIQLSRRGIGQHPTAKPGDLLKQVGLSDADANRYPHQFSGGQRQRIAIARALATGADFLIADEITSALDVSVQASILNLIRKLQAERGLTLIFISHNLSVIRYLSHRIAVLYLGKVVEIGEADQVLRSPGHPYTRTLIDAVLPVGEDSPLRAAAGMDIPDPHHPPSGCRFHPRCLIGPTYHPERRICAEVSPELVGDPSGQQAACHFVPLAMLQRSDRG